MKYIDDLRDGAIPRPQDCAIFGTVRTPENPLGSCRVSSAGACAARCT